MQPARLTRKPRLFTSPRLQRQRRLGFGFLLLALAARAGAQAPDPEGLQFATADGGWRDSAALETDVTFNVTGLLAEVTVEQRYINDGSQWLEGRYLLPLPAGAAVGELRLAIGEREVVGEIHEKAQAQAIYQAAAAQGQRAGMVEQNRPNLFRTSVANIGPGETVTVRIAYWQAVDFRDGQFSIDLPLGLTPRYTPSTALALPDSAPRDGDPHALAPAAVAASADTAPPPVVSLQINLTPGVALDAIESPTHAIETTRHAERFVVRLKDFATLPERDFELRWIPTAVADPQSALFVEQRDDATYAYAMLLPPTQEIAPLPRELILVIDTSGSMSGSAIVQARDALAEALARLRPGDRFNLVQFNSTTEQLFMQPVPADAEHIRIASDWIAALQADGGTEMAPALRAALQGEAAPGFVRQVVFATDAGVGNESALLAQIERDLGEARLFPVGIGNAPNGWFLQKAAQIGRGSALVIRSTGEVAQRMQTLFAKLDRPALRGVDLAWPPGTEAYPETLPDLYHGEPLLAVAKLGGDGSGTLVASGWSAQGEWSDTLALGRGTRVDGVARLWGRHKIESLEDALRQGADEATIRSAIVALGIEHHLVSRYTSLVAVERQVARPSDAALASTRFENGGEDALALAQGATGARSLAAWAAALLLLALALTHPRPTRTLAESA
ncbi:marine proteobacterial sortase target protein [Chiayiivirga flava]|uniref:Ca-activated chloride channel family protein n=1 Tax=Chiayiivirga flava TaxID=659595 RepID=A0A7W8D541_9GAMM|nr:marine proteobacterial sortase target protein [Chiayiivirga flava]MBB5208094.1 Ca-activated chloride channel family protein [Chiayiivirga flava]